MLAELGCSIAMTGNALDNDNFLSLSRSLSFPFSLERFIDLLTEPKFENGLFIPGCWPEAVLGETEEDIGVAGLLGANGKRERSPLKDCLPPFDVFDVGAGLAKLFEGVTNVLEGIRVAL